MELAHAMLRIPGSHNTTEDPVLLGVFPLKTVLTEKSPPFIQSSEADVLAQVWKKEKQQEM